MSLFPVMNAPRKIRPEGNPNAPIAIVGDYTDAFSANALKPFQGSGGQVLGQCLHLAGLIRGEVYLTHLIKSPPTRRYPPRGRDGPCPEYFLEGKGQFTPGRTGPPRRTSGRAERGGMQCGGCLRPGRCAGPGRSAGSQRTPRLHSP